MTLIQAIILGIVQGLTEFIPISSTAHLIFACRAVGLFDGADDALRAEQTTATIGVIQLGTLAAVFVYFARDIFSISKAFLLDHAAMIKHRVPHSDSSPRGSIEYSRFHEYRIRLTHESRLGWFIIIGSIPIGAVGLLFKEQIEGTFTKNLWVIASMLIGVAILLAVAEFVGRKERGIGELDIRDSLIVGASQVLALIPGASRAGSTMMGALFAGLTRETAARFSFLLSIPAISASGLLELGEAVHKLPEGSFSPVLVAMIVAGITGYLSIWFLISFLRKYSLSIFIGYRLVLGLAIVGLLYFGIVSPQQ